MTPKVPFALKAVGIAVAAATVAALSLEASSALVLTALHGTPEGAVPTTVLRYMAYCASGNCGKAGRALVTGALLAPPAAALVAAVALLRRRERPLHGAARFANPSEIRKAGLLGNPDTGRSILVGKYGRELLAFPGNRFALLSAPTRSGKGVGAVIPNCLNWTGGLVVLDIKEENFRISSGWREKVLGQKVFLFAPFDRKGRTHCWNPLDLVSTDPLDRVGDLDMIASSLYPRGKGMDEFWSENAKDLFRGLALLVLETPGIPHTMGQILREASGMGKTLRKHVAERFDEAKKAGCEYSEACRNSLGRVLRTSENTMASIVSTFNVPLLAFQNPRVDAATSETSEGFDLGEIRRRPFTAYLGVTPDKLAEAKTLVNLFFNELINLNTRVLPEEDPTLSTPCLLVLDEFTSVGRIPMVERGVSYIAGYGVRLLTIVQSRSQLEDAYGREGATTILANHALQILFAPSAAVPGDAKAESDALGYYSVEKKSVTEGRGRSGKSVQRSSERRALMLPQELQAMPVTDEIVTLDGSLPIRAKKIRYFEDPFFESRLLPESKSVPTVDASIYRAGVEGRVRRATEAELAPERLEETVRRSTLAQKAAGIPKPPRPAPQPSDASSYADLIIRAAGL